MPERIVVAYDGSEPAAGAAELAFAIAAGCGATVTVVLVPGPAESADGGAAELARLARRAPDADVTCRRATGGVRELRAALAGADLVAAGAHGLGHVGRPVPGGVSRWLLEYAPCPVALTGGRPVVRPARKVLVGLDDSEGAAAVLDAGQRVAAALFAALILVHVADPHFGPYGTAGQFRAVGAVLRSHGRAILHDAHDRLTAPIEAVVDDLREGHPREELLAACAEHQPTLAVVGRADAGGLRRRLAGGTARELAEHAGCAVMAVGPCRRSARGLFTPRGHVSPRRGHLPLGRAGAA